MQENIWRWQSSGSIFNFTNWDSGEPNNGAGGGQDCLVMYPNYKWDDDDCTVKLKVSSNFN